jgi:hypothetical protein
VSSQVGAAVGTVLGVVATEVVLVGPWLGAQMVVVVQAWLPPLPMQTRLVVLGQSPNPGEVVKVGSGGLVAPGLFLGSAGSPKSGGTPVGFGWQ